MSGLERKNGWTIAELCEEARIGEQVTFATKLELAKTMIGRVAKLGLPFAWFTAHEAYGDNGKLRKWLEESPYDPARNPVRPWENGIAAAITELRIRTTTK